LEIRAKLPQSGLIPSCGMRGFLSPPPQDSGPVYLPVTSHDVAQAGSGVLRELAWAFFVVVMASVVVLWPA